jgi:hypothetical protein
MSLERTGEQGTRQVTFLSRFRRRFAREPRRHARRESARHAAAYNDSRIRELGLRYRSLP